MVDRQDQEQPHPYWREQAETDTAAEELDMYEFQSKQRSFSEKVERFLMQVVILGLVALVLIQTLHTNATARRMLNLVEAMEGIPWSQVTAWSSAGPALQQVTLNQPAALPAAGRAGSFTITIESKTLRSVPEAWLLVDGQAVATFGQGRVSRQVKLGQVIAVDGTKVSRALSFSVSGNGGLSSPALGTTVQTRGNVQRLGVVEVTKQ